MYILCMEDIYKSMNIFADLFLKIKVLILNEIFSEYNLCY